MYKPYLDLDSKKLKKKDSWGNLNINLIFNDIKEILVIFMFLVWYSFVDLFLSPVF